MPTQENEVKKAEQVFESQEEVLKKNIAASQDKGRNNSQKLIPFFNAKAEFHQSRINTIDEKIATRQDKISKNEEKIEKLSAKADRLEDKNEMLKATLGNIPGVKQMIEANERKIKEIREVKIPNRQNKIAKHTDRITQLSKKRDVISHKLNRVVALSDAVRSFSVGFNKERREIFTDAMDRLNKSSADCLTDKKNALEERKAVLISTYSLSETSAVDKINLQSKIEDVSNKLNALENKIHKISRPENYYADQTNDMVDAAMKVTEEKLTEITDKGEISVPDIADGVITETQNLESKDLSEIAHLADDFNYLKNTEMAVEDDYNSIDGIINNGSKTDTALKDNLTEEIHDQNVQKTDNAVKNEKDGTAKINPDFYNSLPKDNRYIEVMTIRQAEKVMDKLKNAGIAFSAVNRNNEKTAVTVENRNADTMKDMMRSAFKEMEQESKTVWHQLGDAYVEAYEERKAPDNSAKKPMVKSINSDYFKSITKDNRSISVETAEVGKKVMEKLEDKGIQYSAVERRNNSIAITVSKADENAYKNISDSVKSERAVQFVNPDFYKSLPKEERSTQRMSQDKAERTMQELDKKGIAYSAVLNGNKSAVTVEKKNTKAAYMSRASLKREAQRISNKGKESKNKAQTKKQGLEQ